MPKLVDARGLPCPQPVILARNAMREDDHVIVLVSQRDQVDNVRRLGERAGWDVSFSQTDDGWTVEMKGETVSSPEVTPDIATCKVPPAQGKRVVLISSDQIGRGEPELGHILMRSFLYTLREVEPRPDTLIFLNTGVQLTTEGSPILEDLQALEEAGLQILVCGTCLDYFHLKERVRVGQVSNMYAIAETLLQAGQTLIF